MVRRGERERKNNNKKYMYGKGRKENPLAPPC